ncbi:hypothetical protein TNCV_2583741 [Trichonephila clavipes]|nr:hypothetical protein TNCV_2583741 [Trichonephila clavipes]
MLPVYGFWTTKQLELCLRVVVCDGLLDYHPELGRHVTDLSLDHLSQHPLTVKSERPRRRKLTELKTRFSSSL